MFVPVEKDWKYWAECRPEGDRQDLYFFGYGHDYMAALGDFALDTEAMIANINSWENLSPDFKVKVAAQTLFVKQ